MQVNNTSLFCFKLDFWKTVFTPHLLMQVKKHQNVEQNIQCYTVDGCLRTSKPHHSFSF